ncbi:MAG: aminopeptidase P family protein [Chromatiales bacterium]|nr:aminopeptidase P family protein [Chromatiales bacterium]
MIFEASEYAARVAAARERLRREDLAALLVFAQESHYYLFGYDGGGYVFFQCAVLTADEGPTTLLCRRPDVAQARDTSTIEDVRVWLNAEDADPARSLRAILEEKGLAGARVGIETDNYGLTGASYRMVERALGGWCELVDASDVVRALRLVKSPAEIALIRKAGELADAAVEAIVAAARPGVLDSTLTAACLRAMLEGGGDMPPAGPLVNSGRRAIYGRGVGGPRRLDASDQVMVELAGTFHRYNCCIERVIVVGEPSAEQRAMYDVVRRTTDAVLAAFVPGEPLGRVDAVHRRLLDEAGYASERYAACGYSLGATYRPSWMDVPPMIYEGNPLVMRPGMVFFPHVMLGDKRSGLAMGLGNTVLLTDSGAESLTRLPLDLIAV